MAPSLSKFQRVGLALVLMSTIDIRKEKKKRTWMKRCLRERHFRSHLNQMNLLDYDDIRNILRMEKEVFDELLEMVRPLITKQDTNMRLAVSAEERLIVTLRYLATGRDYRDLRYSSSVSHQLLSKIIPETCRAIFKVLRKTIKLPSTLEEWNATAQSFENQWQFHNCVGCMDGKHILIVKPPGSGSEYYNYKGTFSVVLFAVVNSNYEFMYVHTGSNGSMSDEGIIKNTLFYEKLMKGEMNLPESYLLPGTDVSVPYVFLADSFELDTHVMKPFPEINITREQKIFNYRLGRARRVVDNAFGVLASRFRVFQRPMNLNLENVDAVVLATCALHNFLREESKTYLTSTCVDNEDVVRGVFNSGSWHQDGSVFTPVQNNVQSHTNNGKQIRNILTDYFNGEGSTSFQYRMANVVPSNT